MAVRNLYSATFPQGVSMAMTYDDVTLVVQAIIYTNPTQLQGTLTFTGLVNESIPTTSTHGLTITADLTAGNIVCTRTQITDRFGTRTVVSLPGNETIQFVWPT